MVRCITVTAALALLCGSPPASAQVTDQPPRRFLGSLPTGAPTGTTLPLSLRETFERALKHNLGIVDAEQATREARATRLRTLSALLPDISAEVSGTRERLNLAAAGLTFTIPGVDLPTIAGPFNVADARIYATQDIVNIAERSRWKSSTQSLRAAEHEGRNDREIVVLAAGNAYLKVIADAANVESTRAQLTTAQTLHARAVDQNRAGVVAAIDVLRARVEMQTQRQRLIAADNQLAIDKLMLARIIGLPKGQAFQTTDAVAYAPLDGVTEDAALARALATRADYLAATARVRAAELERQAAVAGYFPSLAADANWGAIGSPGFDAARATFSVAVTLRVPIFQGTRVRADTLAADAMLQRRRAELADLDGQIDTQVRTAFLNLRSSADLVTVAQSNIDLANQTLVQAQDRFAAGVANNLDVVQAQESVAAANQTYIASLYAHNVAKVSLALAIGVAEQSALEYLGAK